MGMGCLIAGAVLLVITELWIPQSVLGFIAPMWLVGVGVATAVSVAPNGALRGFDHIAEPLRQSTSLGGLAGECWNAHHFAVAARHGLASYRVLFGSATIVLDCRVFPERETFAVTGSMMRLHAHSAENRPNPDHWEYGKLSPNKLQPTCKTRYAVSVG